MVCSNRIALSCVCLTFGHDWVTLAHLPNGCIVNFLVLLDFVGSILGSLYVGKAEIYLVSMQHSVPKKI